MAPSPFKILGREVGPVAFGMMGLTARAVPLSDEACFAAIKAALDSGCNYFNAGEFYGPQTNNSLLLLNRYFQKYPEDASKIVLNVKGGFDFITYKPAGSPEQIKKSIDNCLAQLGGTIKIDQWEPARRDLTVNYEDDTLATIKGYIDDGKIGGIALSEVNGDTVRAAAKKHTITALETEVSLFFTEALTNGTFAACAELGIPILAYSALGHGILGGRIKSIDDLPEGDLKRRLPQYAPENLPKNLEIVEEVRKLAEKKSATPGQIAISWLVAISKRPGMPQIFPLPGSSNPDRIKENATIIDLTDEDLKEIDSILSTFKVTGARAPRK